MQNIIIATDSTSVISKEEQEIYQIECFPLNIILEQQIYRDQIDISNELFYQKLEKGLLPTSSQPSLGLIEETMKKWKETNYNAIIIITIASEMSGTYRNISIISEQLNMKRIFIIDSKLVGPALKEGAIQARIWAKKGYKAEDICTMLKKKFQNTSIFLLPHDMTYLKKSGRITPLAASMASLLKINPILLWRKDGSKVDKYSMSRTVHKSYQIVIKYFKEQGVNPQDYHIFLLHGRGERYVQQLLPYLKEHMDNIEITVLDLPPILACHAGLECICVVATPKP